jgi:hypothetical protein
MPVLPLLNNIEQLRPMNGTCKPARRTKAESVLRIFVHERLR